MSMKYIKNKTASTRDIIECLMAYEHLHGIGSVVTIGRVGNGDRDIEYNFYVEDKNGNKSQIDIPTVDKDILWK